MLSSYRNSLLAAAIAAWLPLSATAVEYTLSPSVAQRVYYDSNIVLGPVIEEEVSAYELSPSLLLRARDPRWQMDLRATLRSTRLSNHDYDSDDQLFDFSIARTGERSLLSLKLDANRESTRTLAEEIGASLQALRSENYQGNASYTVLLSERNSLALGINASEARYDSRSRLSNFSTDGFDVGWVRQLSEQADLRVTAYRSAYEFSGVESETDGLYVSYERRASDTLSTFAMLGGRQTETTFPTFCDFFSALFGLCQLGEPVGEVRNKDDGFTGRIGFDYRGETHSLSASVSRSINANAFLGGLLESDNVNLRWVKQLRPVLWFDLAVTYDSESAVDNATLDRDRWRIQPGLRWRFAERWQLTTSLRHRVREERRSTVGGLQTIEPDSTAIFFQLNYTHPRLQWSR